ncbi:HlyD family efflux transporter periplasmic adaptor subunit [Halomonas sp. DN3]|uniref:HlyD family efflux transporter periplasmic adaptor subunit n=1 Tax=Halomonas sp. DN3 TaxID=2953657 RepID=UPI0020A1C628|nr:HlyD family secretion protein [Halomonas sp. DN3]USZ48752.1 HlyD family efflux transporter periplasmic adaptor subunit [Halomonas sp. DN3]
MNTLATPGAGRSAIVNTKASADGMSGTASIRHESRDERRYLRITPSFFFVTPKGDRWPGQNLSQDGFSLQAKGPLAPGQRMSGQLVLPSAEGEIHLPLTASCLGKVSLCEKTPSKIWRFQIVDIGAGQTELLRALIRSHLAGRRLHLPALLDSHTEQTPRKRASAEPPSEPTAGRRRPWFRYLLLLTAFLTLLLVIAATLYQHFFLIEPDFAAVTAPRVEIRAPSSGIVSGHDVEAGDVIHRDEPLTHIEDVDLNSNLILAEAAKRFNQRLATHLEQELTSRSHLIDLIDPAQATTTGIANFSDISPIAARARLDQVISARDFHSARVDALRTRQSQNTLYSPCDCRVAWALSSAGGTFVDKGDRLMTLVRTTPGDVMVEALVHMRDIHRIHAGQDAFISLPGSHQTIPAKVRSLALDVERQPRAGFPEWVRQQQNIASVLVVPQQPLPTDRIGTPVDVRFSDAPLVDEATAWAKDIFERSVNASRRLIEHTIDVSRGFIERLSLSPSDDREAMPG